LRQIASGVRGSIVVESRDSLSDGSTSSEPALHALQCWEA
jgi:hypothetical protein